MPTFVVRFYFFMMTDSLEISHYKVVFPSDLNNNDTLFGGLAMQWMDQVAYVAAVKCARKKMVTVSVGKIRFFKPITAGVIVEIRARVTEVKAATLTVTVDIYSEQMYTDDRVRAVESSFTFAAVDEQGNPIRIR